MKRLTTAIGIILCLVVFTKNSNAQIERGKVLVGGSSNFGFTSTSSNSGGSSFSSINLGLQGGYLITDNLGAGVSLGYSRVNSGLSFTNAGVGVFIRYYVSQFYPEVIAGIGGNGGFGNSFSFNNNYLGGGLSYAIVLNNYISIDPKINITRTNFDSGSVTDIGFRIAINLYL